MYGLDGAELHDLDAGRLHNVDVRDGIVVDRTPMTIVAASHVHRNAITPLRREDGNAYVDRVRVAGSWTDLEIDAVTHADGIAVTTRPLGPRFPRGVRLRG